MSEKEKVRLVFACGAYLLCHGAITARAGPSSRTRSGASRPRAHAVLRGAGHRRGAPRSQNAPVARHTLRRRGQPGSRETARITADPQPARPNGKAAARRSRRTTTGQTPALPIGDTRTRTAKGFTPTQSGPAGTSAQEPLEDRPFQTVDSHSNLSSRLFTPYACY